MEALLEADAKRWTFVEQALARMGRASWCMTFVRGNSLATMLVRKASGRVDGFVIEGSPGSFITVDEQKYQLVQLPPRPAPKASGGWS